MDRKREDAILSIIGDPKLIRKEMADFRRTARKFSSKKLHLVSKYRKQWVAAFEGEVVAHAASMSGLLRILEEKHIPREKTMIRFIDKAPRKLIL